MNNYKLIICPSLVDMNRLCRSVSGGVQWRQCGISAIKWEVEDKLLASRLEYMLFPMLTGPVIDPPQFLPAIISEHNVTVNECVVILEWNEPFISCAGSVSQYVLTVTPPTSDCQSGSGDCVLMTDQTQYNLTVTVDQMYNLTVRADTCRNMQIGEESSILSLGIRR